MIYRVIKQLITLGRAEGLRDKIDVLYAAGSLGDTEYTELIALLEG